MAAAERRVALIIANSAYQHVAALRQSRQRRQSAGRARCARSASEVRELYDANLSELRQGAEGVRRPGRRRRLGRHLLRRPRHGGRRRQLPVPVDAKLEQAAPRRGRGHAAVARARQGAAAPARCSSSSSMPAATTRSCAKMRSDRQDGEPDRTRARVDRAGERRARRLRRARRHDGARWRCSNSPYLEALVKHIAEPGLEINLLFRKVRDEVWPRPTASRSPSPTARCPPSHSISSGKAKRPRCRRQLPLWRKGMTSPVCCDSSATTASTCLAVKGLPIIGALRNAAGRPLRP